jgi:hypothetical protein
MVKKLSWREIGLHALGILCFLSLPVFPMLFNPRTTGMDMREMFKNFMTFPVVITHCLMVVFFYINYFKLIPEYYFTGKRIQYTALVLTCFLVVILPNIILPSQPRLLPAINNSSNFTHPPGFNLNELSPRSAPPLINVMFLVQNLFLFLVLLFFSLVIRINGRLKATEQERLNAEISYLKAQVNPHFLFNTLNGIYALALQKSGDTANALVKLSNMMRYVLTEASAEMVPLEKEMEYLKNYLELQQIRFGGSLTLNFQVRGDTSRKSITPLLIIPLVENAFKYGVSPEEKSEIIIEADCEPSMVRFVISNKKVNVRTVEKTGLGLENVRKRLVLIYPNRHELNIAETNLNYTVSLTLLL